MARKVATFPPCDWIVRGIVNGNEINVPVTTDGDGYGFARLAADTRHPGIEIVGCRRV